MLRTYRVLFALVLTYSQSPVPLVHSQDDNQSGFVSIDCGLAEGSDYTDSSTGINYKSDANLIDSGESKSLSPAAAGAAKYRHLSTLRSFPTGKRNCYTIKPSSGKGNMYLIRATFLYGNYDSSGQLPTFDLNLGPDTWSKIEFKDSSIVVRKEIMHVLSSDYVHVCLINTDTGTPFISALELRPLDTSNSMYKIDSGSLESLSRVDFVSESSDAIIRYPKDVYDRRWESKNLTNTGLSTQFDINNGNEYLVPEDVLRTASTPESINDPLNFSWDTNKQSDQIYVYMHFAEIEKLQANQSREFSIEINGEKWGPQSVVPDYLKVKTCNQTERPETGSTKYTVVMTKTEGSTHPPIINGYEIYTPIKFSNSGTNETDVAAILSIQSEYRVTKDSWQGDPCEPEGLLWDGLRCSYHSSDYSARIISLDLSNSRLTGEIAPSIANLTQLKTLDLSNNDLSGQVPEFLSHLPLSVLNLKGNKFTGPVPALLLENQKNGILSLRYDGSPDEKKKNKSIPAVVGTVLGSILLAAILFGIWMIRGRVRDYNRVEKQTQVNTSDIERKDKQFPHSQEVDIPGNSHKELGEELKLDHLEFVFPNFMTRRSYSAVTASTSSQSDPISMANNLEMTTSLPAIDANHSSNLHNGDNPDNAPATNTSDIERRNRQYTYSEVLDIIGKFPKVLGEGTFGTVYQGQRNGKQVAVKILFPLTTQEDYIDFKNEVELLMRISHKNLTSLLGYCDEDQHKGIILEYMANGSLYDYLSSGPLNKHGISSWVRRLQIALDAAQGLEYLHHGCTPAIIHRDVKTTNILLDEKFQAKVADFGMSKAYPAEGGTHISTNRVAGTPNYTDPDYKNSKRLTEKSDVFSFGVVLIEMITGQYGYITSENRIPITRLLDRNVHNGDFTAVDRRFGENFDETSVLAAVELSVRCVSEIPSTRPTMKTVVIDLEKCLAKENDSCARPRRASA